MKRPYISIIVPVYNGGIDFPRCLDALLGSDFDSFEIIVVDDCSTDGSVAEAEKRSLKVLKLGKQSGPAVARNQGSELASGEILLFIDADVLVRPETVRLVAEDFRTRSDLAALFGSYDDSPGPKDFMSQYRNMVHHYHHQHSSSEASTFWAGCGAIRKSVFEELDGFNHRLYSRPSIEDIELGYRVREKGYSILLDKGIQVKHLKRWGFMNMLRTDVFQRALPWSRLIMESKVLPDSLNLRAAEKLSSLLVALMIVLLPLLFFWNVDAYGVPVAVATLGAEAAIFTFFILLNWNFYFFFLRARGLVFTLKVIPMHILYFIYSSLAFTFCWVTYRVPALAPLYKIVAG